MISIQSVLTIAMIVFAIIIPGTTMAIGWPVFPDSSIHKIGQSYGQLQDYPGYTPFMHTGIDIMVPVGTPVYAIRPGFVKSILTTSAPTHWRVVIGDYAGQTESDAYMYAHLDSASIVDDAGLSVGDHVSEGQLLGTVVHFEILTPPGGDFNHIHFSKIHSTGNNWPNPHAWDYIVNPLDEIDDLFDPDPPVFEDAFGSQKFAFCRNETDSYFTEGETLTGDVDIVCRVYDMNNHPDWKVTPYRIEYRIASDSTTGWINSVCFTSALGRYGSDVQQAVNVIYQNDSTCDSRADFEIRRYFFNVTNTDGDSIIEASDAPYTWETSGFNNGEAMVFVRAHDRAGNSTLDSMTVTIENFFSLSGTVTTSGGDTLLAGAIVTVSSSGQSDTTDELGLFLIEDVGGGTQHITADRYGYWSADYQVLMNTNRQVGLPMEFHYPCGDADGSGAVDIDDVVFLITYIFGSGPAPDPIESGDADMSGDIDIDDVVYLINYIFSGGPAPCP